MSAFGYFGSKLRLAFKLRDELPPHVAWVDLFCGSAAMTLVKPPAPIEIINDLNGDIVNFFKQLRDNSEQLRERILLTPYAREEFEVSRHPGKRSDNMERARQFFVAAMMAINGSFGTAAGGFSRSNSYIRNGMEARVSRWNAMPEYLEQVIARLRRIRVEKRDAIELLRDFRKRPATLVYLDPPYLGQRAQGYDVDQSSREFHQELLDVANSAKCMMFISGYESDLYTSALTTRRGWVKREISSMTKGHNGKTEKRTEVVWFNRAYSGARKRGRVPIRLTKTEIKENKINPLR